MSDRPQPGDVLVMVRTRKGTFLFWSDEARRTWRRSHHHPTCGVHAVSYDVRDGSIYAATNSWDHGPLVQRSDDGGRTWTPAAEPAAFGDDRSAHEVWQVQPGHAAHRGVVWAGTREAGLFRSDDRGSTWRSVAGLNDHPTRATWQPGGGGLILHTIVLDPSDPKRLYACISTGGAYRSEDCGETWTPINRGVRADFLSEPNPETGHCVHKMVLHPARPNVLFQQNHCGVYRSDDRGETWVDIGDGLSSSFGFPIAVHPHDPHTIYVVPLIADVQRVVPDGRMAVWRSRDDGAAWQPLTAGLPSDAWLTILRESLAVDSCDPAGVYVGTTNGQVFASRDDGDHWELMADYLPSVVSVNAVRVV